jgi:hypothetical protein
LGLVQADLRDVHGIHFEIMLGQVHRVSYFPGGDVQGAAARQMFGYS